MDHPSPPSPRGWLGPGWRIAVGAAGLAVLAWAVTLALGHHTAARTLSEVIWPLPEGIGVVAAIFAARRRELPSRLRWAWGFIAAGLGAWFVGDLVYTALTFGGRTAAFPSPADPFFLAEYPLLAAGLVLLPTERARPGDRVRVVLDLATVFAAASVALWDAVLRPSAQAYAGDLFAVVASAGNPVGDLVLLAGISIVLLRRPLPATAAALLWLSGGVVLFGASDLVYSETSLRGTYAAGGWIDAGWLLAPLCFALAALRQTDVAAPAAVVSRATLLLRRGALLLPILAAVVGFALILRATGAEAVGSGRLATVLGATALCALVLGRQIVTAVQNERLSRHLAAEQAKSERLLLSILPAPIAGRLKERPDEPIAEALPEVTVLFADIVGFTPLSARTPPSQLVALLDDIFTRFDAIAASHGLEKIKTIGDAYMAAAGVPLPCPDHAERAARAALEMHAAVAAVARERAVELRVRVGLAAGPVIAGVIGRRKFAYDLWGDTVNTASRMESHGVPGSSHLPAELGARLAAAGFQVEPRGEIEVKGKGPMRTALLVGPPP